MYTNLETFKGVNEHIGIFNSRAIEQQLNILIQIVQLQSREIAYLRELTINQQIKKFGMKRTADNLAHNTCTIS